MANFASHVQYVCASVQTAKCEVQKMSRLIDIQANKGEPHASCIGEDDGVGFGVQGTVTAPHTGNGVVGISNSGDGVFGQTGAFQHKAGVHGVHTQHFNAVGVLGELKSTGGGIAAVLGRTRNGAASNADVSGSGVWGDSDLGNGVSGTSSAADGVFGEGATSGVRGVSSAGFGFLGGNDPKFNQHAGAYGESDQQGVVGLGRTSKATGVFGATKAGDGIGVRGETNTGVGVQGQSFGNGLAGKFIGDVECDGDVNLRGLNVGKDISVAGDVFLANKDVAERFEVEPSTAWEPGMVMVLGRDGSLTPCSQAYDKRAVGIVSGSGGLRPAITLGASENSSPTAPIALVGTAFCLVDAEQAPVEAGDLVTSSNTYGHAMKAEDPSKGRGAIVGKALAPLDRGRGRIPILIGLQ